nr:hypothetical protein Itr_chr06CG17240 [Ipomoea trifida]
MKTVGGERATVLLHSPPPDPPEKKENEGTASPRLSGYLLPLMSYVGHTVAKPQPEPQGVVAAVLVRAPCQKQRPLPSLPSVHRKTEKTGGADDLPSRRMPLSLLLPLPNSLLFA